MNKGAKVTWTTEDGLPGQGVIIFELDDDHALVAVEKMRGEDQEVHQVIRCTVTWLTAVRK